MRFPRSALSLPLVAILAIGWIITSTAAQDTAVPPPEPTPAEWATPGQNPSQYAFYPSDVAQPGGDLPGDPAIQLVQVTDQVFEPINVAAPHDGSGRVFIVERAGVIRILDQNGQVLPEPFLDISDITEYQFLEEGLLGLAFHPDFTTNGLFYVNYTNQLRNGDVLTVQYKVAADNPNLADESTALIVSERNQPYPNHIGGDIQFGPDGFLYIGHGDGGLEGDPLDAGQDLATHLGKMLRIDVTPAVNAALGQPTTQAPVGGQSYLIPPDNPFAQGDIVIDLFEASEEDFAQLHPRARPEIWAYGLRNPWSFSFDRETGDLWTGDVGQNFWEEIDFEPADSAGGINYGWKFLQGSHCFPYSIDPNCPQVGVLPAAEYMHGAEDGGCTVVGGHVYRGQEFTSLQGIYFAADYCEGRFWGLARDEGGAWQFEELLDSSLLVTGAGEDEAGNIYFTACECGYGQNAPMRAGSVWKLVAADQVPPGATTAPTGDAAAATPAAGELEPGATPGASPQASPVASPAAGGQGQTQLTVEMAEFAFNPSELTIPANTDVTVTLPNSGALPHNFNIDEANVHSEDVPAGQSTTLTLNLPPGDYRYYCDIPGHAESGMVGTLHVS